MLQPFLESLALFLVLFNPFLMSVYLIDLIRELDSLAFMRVLHRASVISGVTFLVFAWGGERIFSDVLQVQFASFLIFGGIIILLIAVRMLFMGVEALSQMRGDPQHIAGSIAMPFMIGPGTISASVITGNRLPLGLALIAILSSLVIAVGLLVGFKYLFDYIKVRHEPLLERYVETAGRAAALLTGSIGVQMIIRGLRDSRLV